MASFEQALEALGHLPKAREVVEQSIDLRFNLRNSLWPLGQLTRLIEHLQEAEALAQSLGDERRLGQLAAYMSQFFAWMGEHDKAIDFGERAQVIADRVGDFSLRVAARFRLGQAFYARGDYRRAVSVLRSNIEELGGERATQRLGQTGLPSVLSRAWLAWCYAELGDFSEARRLGEEAMSIANAVSHPFDLVVASFALGVPALRKGDFEESIAVLERALKLCHVGHVPFWIPLIGVWLGSAYGLSGRVTEALPVLEQAVSQHAAIGLMGVHSLFVTLQGEVVLVGGRIDEATRLDEEALTMARKFDERGHHAWALRLRAEIAARLDPPDLAKAETAYREAIALATDLGMRPLLGRCYIELGRLYQRTGHDAALETLERGRALLEELGMDLWLGEPTS